MKIFSSFLFHVSDPDAVGMRPKHFDPWMERNEKEKGRRGEENDNENGKKYYYRKLKKLSQENFQWRYFLLLQISLTEKLIK